MFSHWLIAWRMLISRKWGFLLSIIGVGVGVAFFIMAQAQSDGLQQFFIRTILGANGAIQIQDKIDKKWTDFMPSEGSVHPMTGDEGMLYVYGIDHPDVLKKAIAHFEGVQGASTIIEGEAIAKAGVYEAKAVVQGIDWKEHFPLSSLDEQLIQGKIQTFKECENGLLCGILLARRLGIRVGDKLDLRVEERMRRYIVAGIYETGVESIDKQRVYISLNESRILLNRPHGSSYLQINLQDPKKAPFFAKQLESTLGYRALDWQQREALWLDIFWLIQLSSGLFVCMIMIVGGLGIFNHLTLMVLQKQKDLAILRAIGYQGKEVRHIFALQGLMIYLLGSGVGFFLGFLGTYFLRYMPWRFKGIWIPLENTLMWDPKHYLMASLCMGLVVFLASTLPARKASCLEPGKIIRAAAS